VIDDIKTWLAGDVEVRSRAGYAALVTAVVGVMIVGFTWWWFLVMAVGVLATFNIEVWARRRNDADLVVYHCSDCGIVARSNSPGFVAQFADAHIDEHHSGIAPS
jgi:hypothetical protein